MLIPKLGDRLPQRGTPLSKWFGRMLLRSCHWQIDGEICQSPKFVLVMAPHTSWWDFTTNFGVLLALGLHASWFIANKYTKGVLGTLLAHFGAVSVERSERSDMVKQMVDQFHGSDKFVLAIFPEGTRKPVEKWKTGFWHIAKEAKVPIQLVAVDYGKRATVFGPILEVSEDMDMDIHRMREYFKPIVARHPQNASYKN